MKIGIALLVMLAVSVSLGAEPTTKSTTRPTTQRTADRAASPRAVASSKPSSHPTTQASSFPAPAELVRQIREKRKQQEQLAKVAYFNLSTPLTEKPPGFSFFGEEVNVTLHSLIQRLHQAKDDEEIQAVLISLSANSAMNFAQAQEVRDTLLAIRDIGKRVFVFADGYDTIAYTLASGASDICMLGGGEIMIPGVGMEATFAKGLLDKIGVKAEYVQIGEYKGADEQFTRTAPSDELRGELTKLTESLYDQIVEGIRVNRNLSKEQVRAMIDETIMTGPLAKERGFVDHLTDMDGLRELIKKVMEKDIDLVADYGMAPREAVDLTTPFGLLALFAKQPVESDVPAIALIHAEGVIVDGDGGGDLFSEGGVGSDEMRKAFRIAARDENIKAVVIRIDSPGGSALASEVMWQAARRVAAKKPVIISIGSMAASGGYYLASAGDHIFADPSAIIGSIGVVGGKFVVKDLFDKIGISTEAFGRGRNADLFSSNQPFNERQRTMMTNWMKQTYEQFTQRIMSTRGAKIADIDKVARGRIFLASQARELGMVDELGGLNAAIAYAAGKVDLEEGEYDVRIAPAPKTLADIFNGSEDENQAALPFKPKITVDATSILNGLSPSMGKAVRQQLRILRLLQDRPIMLVTPYTLTVR